MSSGFNGINQFGNLTTQNGVKLKFEDFDKDGDGKISAEEYNQVLEETKLDSVEFSSVDGNSDNTISEEEFSTWERKLEMQAAVNDMAGTISTDFSGELASYIPQLTSELKDFINEFYNNYTGDSANMIESFKEELAVKYEELKTNIIENDPTTIANNTKSYVLDSIYSNLTTTTLNTKGEVINEAISENAAYALLTLLEAEADNFIKNYKGNNLAADLEAHLNDYMNQTDAQKMEAATAEYQQAVQSFGTYIDSNEFKNLKNIAKEFLMEALTKGITIQLAGTNIKTEAAITSALSKFTDAKSLKEAMQNVIDSLSDVSLKDQTVATQNAADNAEADSKFSTIKGSEYQVDPLLINYSEIPGYNDGTQYSTKGKSGAEGRIKEQARETLESDALKSQIKKQIMTMLEEAGVPFEKIENVFENVYNNTINETLDEITIRKTNHKWIKRRMTFASNQDVKTIVDNFITKFNTNIEKAIDEMNASNKDMDLINIDYSVAGKDENGNPIEVNGKDLNTLINTQDTLIDYRNSADYYLDIADGMVERLRSQFLSLAMGYCEANGVEFDNEVFDTIFDNAKEIGKNDGVIDLPDNNSLFTPKKVINSFQEEFTKNLTSWLEKEKSEAEKS